MFQNSFITVAECIAGKLDIIKIAPKQIADKSNNIIILPLEIFSHTKSGFLSPVPHRQIHVQVEVKLYSTNLWTRIKT